MPKHLAIAAVLLCLGAAGAAAAPPTIDSFAGAMQQHEGYLSLFADPAAGKVYVQVPRDGVSALYVNSMPAGVGSNDIGLDRGQIGNTRYVRLGVFGDRVLMVEPPQGFRASSDNPDEVRAVSEAFASSVIAGWPVVAADDGAVLADLSDYLRSDVHGVAAAFKRTGQGAYAVDAARSAVLTDTVRAFPRNSLVEALITLAGDGSGEWVRDVVPTPEAVTVRMRHDWIAPPDDGFEPRQHHPRSGSFTVEYMDFAVPLGEPLKQRRVVRHRLQLKDGKVLNPIVYYVDRGAPEPIRSALIEGASWWAEAFEKAGFPGGFRVELLPEGADVLDVRYNVIQWVHRATRGWSYGWGVFDPRTGEIVKGHVTLGSQRVRQDQLIAEALTAPFDGDDAAAEAAEALALARLRQLSAHEVGHTLGLAHNFAASEDGDASVMDYPHPNLRLGKNGRVDLTQAYDTGVGAWDLHAINYAYRAFDGAAAEAAGLAKIIAAGESLGYMVDQDVRDPRSAANPSGHLWDNGEDALERLAELLTIRAGALEGFSEAVLRPDQPMSEAERRLVPVYLMHRYQIAAVAKRIGGVSYEYGLRGESPATPAIVSAADQRQALEALSATLGADVLELPAHVLALMQPPPQGHSRGREYFTHGTGVVFDPTAPPRAAAQLVSDVLLSAPRARRLVVQHAANPDMPGLRDVLRQLFADHVQPGFEAGMTGLTQESVAWVIVRQAQRLALDPNAGDMVRAIVLRELQGLSGRLSASRTTFARAMSRELAAFVEAPAAEGLPAPAPVPPGAPI